MDENNNLLKRTVKMERLGMLLMWASDLAHELHLNNDFEQDLYEMALWTYDHVGEPSPTIKI